MYYILLWYKNVNKIVIFMYFFCFEEKKELIYCYFNIVKLYGKNLERVWKVV